MITPLIFIPGVMGSRLVLGSRSVGGSDNSSEVPKEAGFKLESPVNWDPDDNLKMLQWYFSKLALRLNLLSVDTNPQASSINIFAPQASLVLAKNPFIREVLFRLGSSYERRGWSTVSWSFYGKLLLSLEVTLNQFPFTFEQSLPFPVYAFGYDWRQSNSESAQKLVAYINFVLAQHPTASQVILITHSMGGLVARAACLELETVKKIRGVIHVAQPSMGSLTAYRRFVTGFRDPFDHEPPLLDFEKWLLRLKFGNLLPHLEFGNLLPRLKFEVMQSLLGEEPLSYSMLMSALPGPMELLPNNLYEASSGPWLISNPPSNLAKIYDVYKGPYQPGIVSPGLPEFVAAQGGGLNGVLVAQALLARLESARLFHERLGRKAHPNTYVVHGAGLRTDQQIRFFPGTIEVTRSSEGDGTVSAESAQLRAVDQSAIKAQARVLGAEHAEMCADTRTINFVVHFVNRIMSPVGQPDLTELLQQRLGQANTVLKERLATSERWTESITQIAPQAGEIAAQVVRALDHFAPKDTPDTAIPDAIAQLGAQAQALQEQLQENLLPNPLPLPDESGVTPQFLERFNTVNFNNGEEINTFFQQQTGVDFIPWFNQHIAKRKDWADKRIDDTPAARRRFLDLWSHIPLMFGSQIGLVQFISLMSVIINETGGTITPMSEKPNRSDRPHPGIAYFYESFPVNGYTKASYNRSPNRTAGSLFRDEAYITAHGQLALADQLARTNIPMWDGVVYPRASFSTSPRPEETGFILETDFFKFRGRGFIQTTWRSNYQRVIKAIQEYAGNNTVILSYKERWRNMAVNLIATQSTNANWDNLFLNTNFEVACLGVQAHSTVSGKYLVMNITAEDLNSTKRNFPGSIFYMGYRVSGSVAYGRLLKRRVVQIFDALKN